MPVLLTADANAPAGGEIHKLMARDFHDAWERAEQRSGPAGTVHGFGTRPPDRRIDWILYRALWRVLQAETVTHTSNGIYPSDHYPVQCCFDIPS